MAEANPAALEVRERWAGASKHLLQTRRNYWLNTSFYHDEQWVWWDSVRQRVESLDDNWGTYQHLQNRTFVTLNRIKPNVNTLLGKWLQNQLRFDVVPTSSDSAALIGHRISQWLLEAAHRDGEWEEIREDNLFSTLMGGTAAVALHVDDDSNPLDVTLSGEVSNSQIVRLDSLNITEFTIEPGSRRQRDARWWQQVSTIPPEQAKDYYGLSSTPLPDIGTSHSALQRRLLRTAGIDANPDLVTVWIEYMRPCEAYPEGSVRHVIGDEVVAETKWPFPFTDRLNLYTFRGAKTRGRWLGDTFVTSAQRPQTLYNYAHSLIVEHLKKAGNARAFYPVGTIDDPKNLTDTPGEWVGYYPTGTGERPFWMSPPNLQRYITDSPERYAAALDDVMHVHDISRGEAPGDRNSGLALSILAEQDQTPLAVMARDQQVGWSRIATMYLETVAKLSGEKKRSARVMLDGDVPLTFKWSGSMLAGQFHAEADFDSVAPHSKAARQQTIVRLKNEFPELFAELDKGQVLRMMEVPGLEKAGKIMDRDYAKAMRENALMGVGDPQIPAEFDDHAKHLAEHVSEMKTARYEAYPQEIKDLFEMHNQVHEMMLAAEAQAQMEINAVQPGLAGLPRANEPVGAMRAPAMADQQLGAAPVL